MAARLAHSARGSPADTAAAGGRCQFPTIGGSLPDPRRAPAPAARSLWQFWNRPWSRVRRNRCRRKPFASILARNKNEQTKRQEQACRGSGAILAAAQRLLCAGIIASRSDLPARPAGEASRPPVTAIAGTDAHAGGAGSGPGGGGAGARRRRSRPADRRARRREAENAELRNVARGPRRGDRRRSKADLAERATDRRRPGGPPRRQRRRDRRPPPRARGARRGAEPRRQARRLRGRPGRAQRRPRRGGPRRGAGSRGGLRRRQGAGGAAGPALRAGGGGVRRRSISTSPARGSPPAARSTPPPPRSASPT